jgi:lipopolysaccharide/colanic/teichoic acid biosynthesis glycosyltransferase
LGPGPDSSPQDGVSVSYPVSPWWNSTGKRVLDILGAVVLLLLLWPVMMVVALVIRWDSDGPALFRQLRPGRGRREFRIFKFRTMMISGEVSGPATTSAVDRRVTGVGRFLRRWKLDELPQLFNVFRGEMSFVGPRPLPTKLWEGSFDSLEAVAVLSVRPGVTSLATIQFRNEEGLLSDIQDESLEDFYAEKILPAKMEIDLEYLSRATFGSDVSVILRTLDRVIRPQHHQDRRMKRTLLSPASTSLPSPEPEPVQVEDQGD